MSSSTTDKSMEKTLLVDPTGADPGPNPLTLAERPTDLRGKRLGLLDNSKANSDAILRAIAEILNDKYEFSDIFYVKKHSSSLPPKPELMTQLQMRADLIVTGIGD